MSLVKYTLSLVLVLIFGLIIGREDVLSDSIFAVGVFENCSEPHRPPLKCFVDSNHTSDCRPPCFCLTDLDNDRDKGDGYCVRLR
uniref:Putative 8 kDa amblyomma family n=1 Tax=Rhipicephalus pulchellus TaxID=72859 RepID=L7MCF4_RHIPC